MANAHCTASIQLQDGSTAIFTVRWKVAEYFNITGQEPRMQSFRRESYTYTRYDGISSDSGEKVYVPSHRITKMPTYDRKTGRKIQVPTELLTPQGHPKTFTITFPVRAKHIDIAHWLAIHCKSHCPKYFLSEAGKKRMVWKPTQFNNE